MSSGGPSEGPRQEGKERRRAESPNGRTRGQSGQSGATGSRVDSVTVSGTHLKVVGSDTGRTEVRVPCSVPVRTLCISRDPIFRPLRDRPSGAPFPNPFSTCLPSPTRPPTGHPTALAPACPHLYFKSTVSIQSLPKLTGTTTSDPLRRLLRLVSLIGSLSK